jgi:KDO2-lipid IV(A) lauroyltransferase
MLSRKFGCPVLYYRVERLRRGFYEIVFEEICSDPSVMPEKGITLAYARILERDIRKQPEQWLWSHRRWKMRNEG